MAKYAKSHERDAPAGAVNCHFASEQVTFCATSRKPAVRVAFRWLPGRTTPKPARAQNCHQQRKTRHFCMAQQVQEPRPCRTNTLVDARVGLESPPARVTTTTRTRRWRVHRVADPLRRCVRTLAVERLSEASRAMWSGDLGPAQRKLVPRLRRRPTRACAALAQILAAFDADAIADAAIEAAGRE